MHVPDHDVSALCMHVRSLSLFFIPLFKKGISILLLLASGWPSYVDIFYSGLLS